jgi:hypothetical protein
LGRGEGNEEPPGYTDKELEELLGEGGTSRREGSELTLGTASTRSTFITAESTTG